MTLLRSMLSRARFHSVAALLLVAAVGACDDGVQVIEEISFDASLGVDLSQMTQTAAGVYIQDRVAGMGDSFDDGDRGFLTYTGWLSDGTQFDTGTELEVVLNTTGLIAGFTDGITGMLVGATRLMVIPPVMGYGNRDNGPIPGGSVLVFEVTLDSIPVVP